MFALFGLIMGSWASRIPALRDGMHVSHSALSLVLLCGGLGAVTSFPLSSSLMTRFGGRRTTLIAGLALLADLVAIGLAPNVPLLMLAVLGLGITASTLDVALNSVATRFEKDSGKSQMARLHAWGCAGGLAGATLGSLMAGMHTTPAHHFMMLAMPLACLLWLACESLDVADEAAKLEKRTFCLPRGPLALLGALGFFSAMSEGSIADWSGLFLKEHFAVGDSFAPLALSSFSVMMLVARLAGDRLKEMHSAQRLVSTGGIVSAAGLFFAVFSPNAYFALIGFAAAGLGLALVFPFVFSAAGRQGPMALAGVATMGYSGSLMGPPVIGSVAHHFGMPAAIGFVGLLSMAITFVAGRAALLK
ncbi:MFS transporter [Noviherbaspirillum sp. DKR-6]|uniref:MFS transporter n=1 Tax=Noviherbaspirillum pedocola TaxID=2801341 RepID=A0A934SZ65_9BURK|nr:MFS transporter [Noviherbaspirillum pedocola]